MDLWIFAYGSLMWRPGFRYEDAVPAVLEGAHRSLCLYSAIHRGTHKAPGLVLGLDKGGQTSGLAYRVASSCAPATRAYLRRRENMSHAYAEAFKPVRLSGQPDATIPALCFLTDRRHSQYAGNLPIEWQAHLVRRSSGVSGRNIDYVVNTVRHLRALGVHDTRLERLMAVLGHGLAKK